MLPALKKRCSQITDKSLLDWVFATGFIKQIHIWYKTITKKQSTALVLMLQLTTCISTSAVKVAIEREVHEIVTEETSRLES